MPTQTLVTSGVEISVESEYQPNQSDPMNNHFLFAYRITIRNTGDSLIRLRNRHWYIFDSCNKKTHVDGEGVVGENPILAPGEDFQYVSGCNLTTDTGRMFGAYMFEKVIDNSRFYVKIPVFYLIAPFRLN